MLRIKGKRPGPRNETHLTIASRAIKPDQSTFIMHSITTAAKPAYTFAWPVETSSDQSQYQAVKDWIILEIPSNQYGHRLGGAIREIPPPGRDALESGPWIPDLGAADAPNRECCQSVGRPVRTSWRSCCES